MDVFLTFLKENYRLIIEGFILVLTIIVLLLKKNKVNILSDSVLVRALLELPNIIERAENQFGKGNGKDKFKYVFVEAISFISKYSGVSVSDVTSMYGETLSKQIEEILETPQKKKG